MLTLEDIQRQYPEHLRTSRSELLREYLQYKMLEIIFASEYAAKLVFIGGTALRIVHGNSRFSEDLDFDNFGLTEEEFRKMADKVKSGLEANGFKVEISFGGRGSHRCNVRFPRLLFDSGLSQHPSQKVLVQIDSLAQGFDYKPERKMLNKFDVFTEVFVPSVDLLLSQKINAMLTRKRAKGRDFYDIIFLLSFTKPNYQLLEQRCGITGSEGLRAKLVEISSGLDFIQLAQDVRKFLFNPNDVKKVELFPKFIQTVQL